MNNIYRRQPVVHQLPSDYSDLDNIKYLNLNNIQGLQIYDNPIAAEQNSTYSCKNTYRDELGNLTVRPEIWYNTAKSNIQLDTLMHWYFDTQYGKKIYLQSETTFDTLNINTDTVFQRAIVKGSRVAVQETADATYILLQDNATQELQFWKFDGDTCEQCTGEIQLNNQLQPDLALYNILNNKAYSAQLIINSDTTQNTYNRVITLTSTLPSDNIAKILKYSKGLAVFYYNENILYSLLISNDGLLYQTELGKYPRIDMEFRNYDNISIKEYPDAEYFDITILYDYTEEERITGVVELSLSFDGTKSLTKSNTINRSNYIDYQQLYDGYYLLMPVKSNTSGNVSLNVEIYKAGSKTKSLTLEDSHEYIITSNNIACYNIFATDEYLILANIPSNYTSYSSYLVSLAIYDYKDSVTTAIDTVSITPQLKYHISQSSSVSFSNIVVIKPAIYNSSTGDFSGNKNYSNTRFYSNLDISNSELFTLSELNYDNITTDGNSLYIYDSVEQISSIIKIETPNKDIKEYEFDSLALVFEPWVFEKNNLIIEYYERKVVTSNVLVDRPTESIPVLSDFKENVITSFYLDGFYWFVTEHRVFGTGAANGVLTIEFFDPLKYFAFTEKLTAAMRVSDTSFWLFHNAGAYLIYKASVTTDSGTEYRWMCTNTPKSKGCDFENAVVTLPVTSAVAVVTAEDICSVEMKENIQSDDRSLVPMTLNFRNNIRELLQYTSDIVIATYRYLTIFFLNKEIEDGTVPAVVFDSTIDSWWYWEFPADRIYQATQTETNVDLFFKISGNSAGIYNLAEDRFIHQIGSVQYEIYADRLYLYDDDDGWQVSPVQISWEWESAVLLFGTVDYRKQLLFTTFVFDDYHEPDNPLLDNSYVNFEFYFKIYSRKYATTSPQVTNSTVERVTNNACRTMVANYNYLQLVMRNRDFDMDSYEAMTKPKICSISMKYRILRGTLT